MSNTTSRRRHPSQSHGCPKLEKRRGFTPTVGSDPTLSATFTGYVPARRRHLMQVPVAWMSC